MKMTLIEMVQRILEAIDGQMINSIEDTREAVQVANCIKEEYYHLLYTREIKTRNNICYVDSLSDTTHPTYFKFRDDICSIDMFKYYDKDTERYIDLKWKEPEQFIEDSLNICPTVIDEETGETNVETCEDFSGIEIKYYNDRCPRYFTSFDDTYIVCDAYNKKKEDTLEQANVVMYGIKLPTFKVEDTFVPDLAPQHFGALLSKARVKAMYELNREYDQMEDNKGTKEIITANTNGRRIKGEPASWWRNRKSCGRRIR